MGAGSAFLRKTVGKLNDAFLEGHGKECNNLLVESCRRAASKIEVRNEEIIMKTRLACSRRAEIEALIDTGAQISLVKLSLVEGWGIIDIGHKMTMRGIIGDECVATVGAIATEILIGDEWINHTFQVVDDIAKQVRLEIVLGSDFLEKNKAIINYEKQLLEISMDSETYESVGVGSRDDAQVKAPITLVDVQAPKLPEPQSIFKRFGQRNEITLPGRTECIIELATSHGEPMVVIKRELTPGIRVGNAVVVPENGHIKIAVANSLQSDYRLEKEKLMLNIERRRF